MKKIILLLLPCVAIGATKPTSPALQSGNSLSTNLVRAFIVGSSTSTITDYSTSASNLTISGSPSLTTAPGGVGNELLLNGTNQYASGSDTGFPSGAVSWSIAYIFKTSTAVASSPGAFIAASWAPAGGSGAAATFGMMDFSADGNPPYIPNSVGLSPGGSVENGSTPENDGAYHIALFTYNVSSHLLAIYVDGVNQATFSVTLGFTPLTGTFTLGALGSGGGGYFPGALGDMYVWNGRVLTSTDATNLNTDFWSLIRPPGSPISGTITKNGISGLTTVSLTVGAASNGTPTYSYQWQRSPAGAGTWTNVGTNALTLNDTGLSTGTNYDYRNIVTDSASLTATSATLTIITLFPVNDSHVTYSPGCWYVPTGAPYATTNNSGAEFRFGFTGTSAQLAIGTTNVVLADSGMDWSIDGGIRTVFSALANPTVLATGLASGTHTVRYWSNYVISTVNDWNVDGSLPDQMVTIIGIQLDVGGTMATGPSVPTDKFLLNADSIGAGTGAVAGPSGGADSYSSYANAVAIALNSEIVNLSYNSSAWATTSTSGNNVPAFASVFNQYFNGQPRSISGMYKRAMVELGRNDTGSVASAVTSGLTSYRAALGSTTKVYVVTPFGGANTATLTSGFASYCSTVNTHTMANGVTWQSCSADANTFLINLGANFAVGLTGTPSLQSSDGTHPFAFVAAQIGAAITQTIQQIEGGGSGSSAAAIVF